MSRLPPKNDTIRRLFALSGNICAFPGCRHELISGSGKFVGQICHIEAAELGGERYNSSQTDEDRRAFDNLMLLCYAHHVETDDIRTYTPHLLKQMKTNHESNFQNDPYPIPHEYENGIFTSVYKILDNIYGVVKDNNLLIQKGNRIGEENQEALSQIQGMLNEMRTHSILKTDESSIQSEQLDFIKQLRKENKVNTALSAAIKFKNDKWSKINDELKFKTIANIASILFETGKTLEAAEHLLELRTVNFENGETSAYISLAYAILGDQDNFKSYFQKALSINPNSINLWIGYIYIQSDETSPEIIREGVIADMLEKPEVLYALGEAYIDRGNVQEGFDMLSHSLAMTNFKLPSLWQVKAMYATKKLVNIVTVEKVVFNKFNKYDVDEIKGAVEIISEAWDHIRDTELAKNGWYMLLNRAIAYKVLGEVENAERDFLEAYRLSGKFDALKNLVLYYLDNNKLDKADRLIKSNQGVEPTDGSNFEWQAIKARVKLLQGDSEAAVSIMDDQLTLCKDGNRVKFLDSLTLILFECGNYVKALPYALQIITEFPDYPNGYLAAGICYSKTGEISKALSHFSGVLPVINNTPQRELNLLQLGAEYMNLKVYDKAAEVYEMIISRQDYNATFKNLILCYFYDGRYDTCVSLCLDAIKMGAKGSVINEVLFRIFEEQGEDEKAEEILNEQLHSDDIDSFDHFRLLGIKFFNQIGKKEEAALLASNIHEPENLDLAQRATLSRILLENGFTDEGKLMLYNARLDNYEKSISHVKYLQTLGIRRSGEVEVKPQTIEINTAFILGDKEQKDSFYFITDNTRITGQEVLRPTDGLSKRVIGRQVGDEIDMPNNVGIGSKLFVKAIFDKYGWAFLDSKKLLETKYIGESDVKFFQNKPDDFSTMQEFMIQEAIQANKYRENLYRIYEEEPVPIGMLSQYETKTRIEVWLEMITSGMCSPLCYTHDEHNDVFHASESEMYVVIDCTTLLTVFVVLNNKELLAHTNFKWVLSKSTIEELQTYKNQVKTRGAGMSVVLQSGELRRSDFSQEQVDRHVNVIDSIIEWCQNNALIATPRRNRKLVGEIEDISDVIGLPSNDTLLLANELRGVLMSDDERLKMLGRGMYELNSFSTYQYLVYSARKKKITPEKFIEDYRELINANYSFIPVSGADMWYFFDKCEFKIQGAFITSVNGLKILTPALAAGAVVSFAKHTYLNLGIPDLRKAVLIFILRSIKTHNLYPQIKYQMEAVTHREFRLLPLYRNEFIRLLKTV